jgi:ceramide glucosyltransferase
VRICLIHVHHPAMNPKIAILERLTREALGSVLVVTDSDVGVTPQYLARVVSPLADPGVGVVTCPYFSRHSGTLPSRLQTLYLNACFLPSVIVAMWALGVRAGLGATIAVRRRDLMRAGGYAGIADYLTDDYQVAMRVAALGLRVELSDYVVENLQGAASFREAWEREVRWSSGIRVNGPIRHLGIGVTFTLPLALGAAAASGFSTTSLAMLAAILLTRTLLAWRMLSILDGRQWHPEIAWLPIRECLSMLVWAAAIMGRRIRWRGREFELLRNGRLEAI